MSPENETNIIDNLGDEFAETLPFTYSITSYGADYPVDGLVKRLAHGDIYVPPFQRGYVWPLSTASRFIESLLLGLPVPGIFLAKEQETHKLLVIDGQQRLKTLQYFYEGVFPDSDRVFALKGVQSQFNGATYKSLKDEDRRRLDDTIIHATVVKQDEPSQDQSSIYHIFERLNTEGLQLQPQEIRACLYDGEYNDLLRHLNQNTDWRALYGPVSNRMKDQELILRFLALYFDAADYHQPMKGFLNKHMGKNRRLSVRSGEDVTRAFAATVGVIRQHLGQNAFRPKRVLNAAVYDAVMVGVARRLSRGPIANGDGLQERYDRLVVDPNFVAATETGTSQEASVALRLDLAISSFADVQ